MVLPIFWNHGARVQQMIAVDHFAVVGCQVRRRHHSVADVAAGESIFPRKPCQIDIPRAWRVRRPQALPETLALSFFGKAKSRT